MKLILAIKPSLPFGLSLSKPCPYFTHRQKEGRPFGKLGTSGKREAGETLETRIAAQRLPGVQKAAAWA
jgi:hypothetical protein